MALAFRSMLLAAFALLGSAACSDEGDPPEPDENGQPLPAGSVDCTTDPRLGDYMGIDSMGELGVLAFRLDQVAPSPPARGLNVFQLYIQDTSGTPMVGELRVDPQMPDHGHGTSLRPRVLPGEGGQYTVEQLYLFMAGIWRIELEAREGGTVLDRKALFFCIQG